jgi:hypothetical protein
MKKNFLKYLFTQEVIIIFVLLTVTYAFFYDDSGFNGNSRLALTFSLVEKGSLSIDPYINNNELGMSTKDAAVVNGHYYTDKAIGTSILAAVIYYPIHLVEHILNTSLDLSSKKHLLTFLVIGIPSALAGSFIYWLCEYFSKSKFRAFVVTLAITFGTMCFPYSVTFFGHQLAGSFLFMAFFAIFLINIPPLNQSPRYIHTFLIGFLLGLALQTEYTTAIVIIPLIIYYFVILRQTGGLKRVGNYLLPLVGGLLPILVIFTYNTVIFGHVFSSGYQYEMNPYYKMSMSKGIMGIGWPHPSILFYETFHPAQGIVWLSPVLLMVAIGAFSMLREKKFRIELALSLFVSAAFLLMNSGYYMWWGGNSLGPRNVIPMLPFLCIPLIFVPKRYFPGMILLTAVSVFQMTIASASQFLIPGNFVPTIKKDPFFNYSNIYSNCLVQLRQGRFGWNIGIDWLGLKGWFSLLLLIVIQGGITTLFFVKSDGSSGN